MSQTGTQAVTTATILGLKPMQIVDIVAALANGAAKAVAPGATVAGMTIPQIIGLAVGIANEVPQAVEAFDDLKAIAQTGQAPTPEQWAKLNAAADDAHAAAQAAADQVIKG